MDNEYALTGAASGEPLRCSDLPQYDPATFSELLSAWMTGATTTLLGLRVVINEIRFTKEQGARIAFVTFTALLENWDG